MYFRLTLAALLLALLTVPAATAADSFNYSQNCVSNVENATIHVPSSVTLSLPNGRQVEAGDTLAVYTSEGDCAGYGVWRDGQGVTLAAAAQDPINSSAGGYSAGETLKFEVFDVSTRSIVDLKSSATFASCDGSGLAICRDDGAYTDDTIYRIKGFEASTTTISRTITTSSGWNLLSVPIEAQDPSFDAVLSKCSSGFFFAQSTGYSAIDTSASIPVGEGGFFQCQPDTTSVTGQVATPTVEVEAGWNAIGAFEDTVAVNAVTSSPSGIVASDFFKITTAGGYQAATALHPGRGYWVKVNEAGTLDLSGATKSSALAKTESKVDSNSDTDPDAVRLTVSDAQGRQATLWFKKGLSDVERQRFEVPPTPPADVFDVRFSSGYTATSFTPSNETTGGLQHRIDMQGTAFPVELRLEGGTDNHVLRVGAGGQMLKLSNDHPSAQLQQSTDLITVEATSTPSTFALGKSYPNPIQDQAIVKYTLAEESNVSIAMYDVLGRRVAQLVRSTQRAGVHQAQIEARDLSSGVYFVRMKTGSFQKTRRLTVVK